MHLQVVQRDQIRPIIAEAIPMAGSQLSLCSCRGRDSCPALGPFLVFQPFTEHAFLLERPSQRSVAVFELKDHALWHNLLSVRENLEVGLLIVADDRRVYKYRSANHQREQSNGGADH